MASFRWRGCSKARCKINYFELQNVLENPAITQSVCVRVRVCLCACSLAVVCCKSVNVMRMFLDLLIAHPGEAASHAESY